MVVLAAHCWPSNAELIADVANLGYVRPQDSTLDMTYGKGVWWRKFRPDHLVFHDLRLDGVDFRCLPEESASFDVVAFDPPYVCVGGRATSGVEDMYDRYGLIDAPSTPSALQCLIDDGLAEAARVVRSKGVVLVKCQDYVSSGQLWSGTHRTLTRAMGLGLTLVDRFEHYSTTPRPQPTGRKQVHARRNLSTLFVLRAQ